MVGTVAGGVIGYCVMLNTKSATNPYALMVIACTIAFFSAFPANTQVSCCVPGRNMFNLTHNQGVARHQHASSLL